MPKLDISVDKMTLSTELLSTNMVVVTLQGSDGFAGPVSLAGSVVDTADVAIPGWVVSLDNDSVDVAANGTAMAVLTLKIPSQTPVFAGTVKIDATSSLGAVTATAAVTVANQLSIPMAVGNGVTCGQAVNSTLTIAQGTKVRWVNRDPTKRITIHINNGLGFVHEPDPGMSPAGLPGDTYEQTGVAAGVIIWYCHAPGNDVNRYNITLVP